MDEENEAVQDEVGGEGFYGMGGGAVAAQGQKGPIVSEASGPNEESEADDESSGDTEVRGGGYGGGGLGGMRMRPGTGGGG